MKSSTDSFLHIGKSHNICEDYIIHGPNYVILSDGCSSSKNTDIGARILTLLARKYINTAIEYNFDIIWSVFGSHVINGAKSIICHLGIPSECLDATLIVLVQHQGKIRVFMYGDGNIIVIDDNGMLEYDTISFGLNAPYYLSYWINDKKKEDYLNNSDTVKICTDKYEIQKTAPDEEISYTFDILPGRTILIASDGIESFLSPEKKSLAYQDVIDSLTAFKGIQGEFVKKRAKRQIKTWGKEGITHYDDISIGGIHIPKGE